MNKKIFIIALLLVAISTVFIACNQNPQGPEKQDPVKYSVSFMKGETSFETQSVESGNTAKSPATEPEMQNYMNFRAGINL